MDQQGVEKHCIACLHLNHQTASEKKGFSWYFKLPTKINLASARIT